MKPQIIRMHPQPGKSTRPSSEIENPTAKQAHDAMIAEFKRRHPFQPMTNIERINRTITKP
jgi:hypothetical protein